MMQKLRSLVSLPLRAAVLLFLVGATLGIASVFSRYQAQSVFAVGADGVGDACVETKRWDDGACFNICGGVSGYRVCDKPGVIGEDGVCHANDVNACKDGDLSSGWSDCQCPAPTPTPGGIVWCASFNCAQGDVNGDGECKQDDSTSTNTVTPVFGTGTNCPQPACGQIDYYNAGNPGDWQYYVSHTFSGGFPNCGNPPPQPTATPVPPTATPTPTAVPTPTPTPTPVPTATPIPTPTPSTDVITCTGFTLEGESGAIGNGTTVANQSQVKYRATSYTQGWEPGMRWTYAPGVDSVWCATGDDTCVTTANYSQQAVATESGAKLFFITNLKKDFNGVTYYCRWNNQWSNSANSSTEPPIPGLTCETSSCHANVVIQPTAPTATPTPTNVVPTPTPTPTPIVTSTPTPTPTATPTPTTPVMCEVLPPTSAKAVAINNNTQIQITWGDPNDDEFLYSVFRSVDGGEYNPIATPGQNSTGYIDANVSCGHSYSYQIHVFGDDPGAVYNDPLCHKWVPTNLVVIPECGQEPTPYCPLIAGEGDILIKFDGANNQYDGSDKVYNAFTEGGQVYPGQLSLEESVNLLPGRYKVTLASFDSHSWQLIYQPHSVYNQKHEQYKIRLFNGQNLVADTGVIRDLADDKDIDYLQVANNLLFATSANRAVAEHAYGDMYLEEGSNSVYPVCALFTKLDVPTSTPTPTPTNTPTPTPTNTPTPTPTGTLTPSPTPTATPTVTPTPKTKKIVIYRSGRPIIPHKPVNTSTGIPETLASVGGVLSTALGSLLLKKRFF